MAEPEPQARPFSYEEKSCLCLVICLKVCYANLTGKFRPTVIMPKSPKFAKITGSVIIPYGVTLEPHELEVAQILAKNGSDVEFIPVRIIPTPDIIYEGREWEIKSPIGGSSRTLENNLRLALRQSPNIILDLRRIKSSEANCLRELRRQTQRIIRIKKLLVITKQGKIVDIL